MLSYNKIRKFIYATQHYLLRHPTDGPYRLDVVAISQNSGADDDIRHYQNITL